MPRVQRLIVKTLRAREYRPVELLESLQANGFSEAVLKEALAHLIDSRRVALSRTRRVKLREQ